MLESEWIFRSAMSARIAKEFNTRPKIELDVKRPRGIGASDTSEQEMSFKIFKKYQTLLEYFEIGIIF